MRALEPSRAPYGRWLVASRGKRTEALPDNGHLIEIRRFDAPLNSCSCVDFRVNRLGTCKHIEAVLHAKRRSRNRRPASRTTEIFLDRSVEPPLLTHADLGEWKGVGVPEALRVLEAQPTYDHERVAELNETIARLKSAQRRRWRIAEGLERQAATDRERAVLAKRLHALVSPVADPGEEAANLADLTLPLYPYQRDGMLHLVTRRRAILADEMGLGKTVQAIAACALLGRLGLARRVLVVCPASLKSEWAEQIALFTTLDARIVAGNRGERLKDYADPAFFTLTNYEQILRDGADIQARLAPDIIVLDEAQRIKNWQSKTADAIKRLESPYAFVLSGTPLENRIDEIYSIMQFIDPTVLGPLFRFNRAYYVLDERGRPQGYQRLDQLHRTLAPHLLRRGKDEVAGELPPCSVRTIIVPLDPEQRLRYEEHQTKVARLMAQAKRRPLLPPEMKRLQIELGCMRMTCDSNYILDQEQLSSPKLDELEPLLDELLAGSHKIIVFSEWTRMLELLERRLEARGADWALHTGAVPQKRRRAEIDRFKRDADCRLLLSSESGGSGLNLQVANVVVNLDLPWNPAKLAQRIARAWRKHQKRSVQVINLVAEDSIEQSMLGRLEAKQRMADAVLGGGLSAMDLPSGRGAMLSQLDELMGHAVSGASRARAAGSSNIAATSEPALGVSSQDSMFAARADDLAATVDEALNAFPLSIRQIDHFIPHEAGSSAYLLLVAAVAEHDAIGECFDAGRDDGGGKGGGQRPAIRVVSPETLEQMLALHEAGLVTIAGERVTLVREGQLVAPADCAHTLQEAIAPHRRSLEAAALLESSGFDTEARAMLDGVLPALADALAPFSRTALPHPRLSPDRWKVEPPTATALLEAI